MLPQLIEEASLNALPALHQTFLDGWLVRLSNGYTKRCNSVLPLYGSVRGAEEKIAWCERHFEAHKIRPAFRITPLARASELEPVLERHGYPVTETVDVMHARIDDQAALSSAVEALPLETWMPEFIRLKGLAPETGGLHQALIARSCAPVLLAALRDGERWVACARGVLDAELCGVFDVIVAPECRNRGHARTIVSAILGWARAQGAGQAYLQVAPGNAPARHVYGKLGFRDVYSYWYREKAGLSG